MEATSRSAAAGILEALDRLVRRETARPDHIPYGRRNLIGQSSAFRPSDGATKHSYLRLGDLPVSDHLTDLVTDRLLRDLTSSPPRLIPSSVSGAEHNVLGRAAGGERQNDENGACRPPRRADHADNRTAWRLIARSRHPSTGSSGGHLRWSVRLPSAARSGGL